MELMYFRDKLFDLLNDSEGMGISDLDADERNSLITVRTEAYSRLYAVGRQMRRPDGRTQTDSLLWTRRI